MIDTTNTICPEWQNENMLRSYPVEDDAQAGSQIPTWVLSDMRITADTVYHHLFVSNVYVSETLVSVGVSGITRSGDIVGLLTKAILRANMEPFKTYSFDRLTDSAAGAVSFGMIPDEITDVKMTLGPNDAKIVPSAVIRSRKPGVQRIIDSIHGREVSGIVDLSGNNEFRTYLDPNDTSGKTIVIRLDDTYRDMTTSICGTEPSFSSCGETPVKTVNGVAPTKDGTLTIRFR